MGEQLVSLWGDQHIPERVRNRCPWGDPEVLGDGTLVFPRPGHPSIDGFRRQDDERTFVPVWPQCRFALNALGVRNKKYVNARRWCYHKDHPLFKKPVKYGDCTNCKLVQLLEDWDDEED